MHNKKETNINLNALPLAREEYEKQLVSLLQPLITKGFWAIYNDAKKICEKEQKEYETFKRFQYFVKKIRNWSSLIVDTETERIKSKISCLSELITIIFVGNVKILASIRLKGKHANIKIKVPSCNNFIHSVYINTAKRIFYDPMIFDHTIDPISKEHNMNRVYVFIEKAISETISQHLPLDNILNEYLGNCFEEELSESEDESEVNSEGEGESLYGDDIKSDSDDDEKPLKLPPPVNKIDFGNKLPDILQNNYGETKKPKEKSSFKVESDDEYDEDTEGEPEGEQEDEQEDGKPDGDESEDNKSDGESNEGDESEDDESEDESEGDESENESEGDESEEEEVKDKPPLLETGPSVPYKKPVIDTQPYKNAFRSKPIKFKTGNFKPTNAFSNKFRFNKNKFFDNRISSNLAT